VIDSDVIKRNEYFIDLMNEEDYFFATTVCGKSSMKILGQNFRP